MPEYNPEMLATIFAVSEESPSGLVFNTIVYGGKNNKQHIRVPGQPAGSKEYSKRKDGSKVALAWRATYNGIVYQAHRVIWAITHGYIPEGYVVDHLDGDPFNNKVSNLLLKTTRANNQNMALGLKNKSGVMGVFLVDPDGKPAWRASWSDINGKQRHKTFSINKYGYDAAFELALKVRQDKINELKELGMAYTERHGT